MDQDQKTAIQSERVFVDGEKFSVMATIKVEAGIITDIKVHKEISEIYKYS